MELKLLEDFAELASLRNFSSAATARHVTQPAFSRRIRALENWIGTELVDRSTYPIQLTSAGETFLEVCRDLIRETYRVRDDCRQQSVTSRDAISISALHTVALNIFPRLLLDMEDRAGEFITRMHATDFHDCVESLALGRCDIAFCYAHEFGPPVPRRGQFVSKAIGIEPFCLASAPSRSDDLAQDHRRSADAKIPLVSYSSDCFFHKLQTQLSSRLEANGLSFYNVYENSMSEALKRMILAGKGVGWLPMSAMEREIERGELVLLGNPSDHLDLDVLALRKQCMGTPTVERFWASLPEHDGQDRP